MRIIVVPSGAPRPFILDHGVIIANNIDFPEVEQVCHHLRWIDESRRSLNREVKVVDNPSK